MRCFGGSRRQRRHAETASPAGPRVRTRGTRRFYWPPGAGRSVLVVPGLALGLSRGLAAFVVVLVAVLVLGRTLGLRLLLLAGSLPAAVLVALVLGAVALLG